MGFFLDCRTLLRMLTCLRCGQENAEGARFCGACGAKLTAAAGREVRKTVTVLFADVTGSTALGEQLDPESLRRVMARYFDAARTCLERQGGTVEKFIGDAVMAVFGVPIVHEDDALRALRAAAELRDSLASLNDELEHDYGVSLELRTGVNTGEVVTGTEERLATGDSVNVAARLEQAAQPGDILVGEPTVRLARDAVEVEPVEPLELKGKAELLPAYRLVRVVEGAPAFDRRLDAPLVGRREELAQVRAAFEGTVSERRCHLVTVLGAPGIGKSRLAREVAAALGGEAAVFAGRCLPYGEGITYWPLREIFASADAEEELEAALGQGAPEEIFWEVRKALERRAREQPLALFVEDIHWAEPTLLDLIEHLTDWTRDAPLLLLCLARPELLDERPGWPGQCFSLDPLSEAESGELIEGLIPGSPLDEPTRDRIRKAAEGNPLFVEQLLAVVAEGGALNRIPPTIQALLEARLDALPEAERDVLERAAVIGLEFEWTALAELDREQRRPGGVLLAALVRKELIRPHDAIEDTFQFRHALIRDAAYQSISKDLRADLHERFAGWFDGRGEEFDEIVGYHFEQAYRSVVALGPEGDRSRALAGRAADRLAASGLRANARGDTLAAADLLERATSLLPADDPGRLSLLPSLGRALREAGEMERADRVLSEAVERGRAVGARGSSPTRRCRLPTSDSIGRRIPASGERMSCVSSRERPRSSRSLVKRRGSGVLSVSVERSSSGEAIPPLRSRILSWPPDTRVLRATRRRWQRASGTCSWPCVEVRPRSRRLLSGPRRSTQVRARTAVSSELRWRVAPRSKRCLGASMLHVTSSDKQGRWPRNSAWRPRSPRCR